MLLQGTFEVFEPVAARFEGPAAFLLDEEQHEGADGRRPFLYRAFGSPFVAIDLRLRAGDMSCHPAKKPALFDLDARAWEAARRLGNLHATPPGSEAALAADLLDGLARSGIVPPDIARRDLVDDDRFSRLWSALAPMVGRYYGMPTLQEVARGSRMSLRQTARQMTEFFDAFHFIGTGWRDATRRWRLKLATLGRRGGHLGRRGGPRRRIRQQRGHGARLSRRGHAGARAHARGAPQRRSLTSVIL